MLPSLFCGSPHNCTSYTKHTHVMSHTLGTSDLVAEHQPGADSAMPDAVVKTDDAGPPGTPTPARKKAKVERGESWRGTGTSASFDAACVGRSLDRIAFHFNKTLRPSSTSPILCPSS